MTIKRILPPSTTVGCIYAKRVRSDGYGVISVNGKERTAHRVTWERTYGFIPNGLFVLHRCDNRPCINPEHLFLGTQRDNCHDRKIKGREADRRGEKNGRVKITVQTAIRIKILRGVLPQYVIGGILGLTQATVGKIMTGAIWKHVSANTRFAF